MCKTWKIAYTCNHHWPARLSTCHATFTIQSRPGRPLKPACCSAPVFVVKSEQACGDCQRAKPEAEMAQKAELDVHEDLYKLWARFPTCRQYRAQEKAGKGRCGPKGTEGRGSLLMREVLPEDVVDGSGGAGTWSWYAESWGEYKALAEELAQRRDEERAEESWSTDLPMTGSMGESMDEYLRAFSTDEEETSEDNACADEQQDESAWSSPWSEEFPSSASWTSKETLTWSSATGGESSSAESIPTTPQKTSSDEPQNEGTSLPITKNTIPPHQRSTFDSVQMDIELRERLKCLRLPHLIAFGGD